MTRIIHFIILLTLTLNYSIVYAKKPTTSLPSFSCSTSDSGAAIINEVYLHPAEFIEIKILAENTDTNGWELCYQKTNSSEACTTSPFGATYGVDSYLVYRTPSSAKINQTGGEILIKDSSGNAINAFLFCNDASCIADLWDVNAACLSVLTNHDSSAKDIARRPDGTGELQDNGSTPTEGYSNDDELPSDADSFNCIEPNAADATAKQIFTKLAGSDFSLDIVAIKNAAIDTNYNQTVAVEIIDQANANTVIYSDGNVNFVNNVDNGRKSITFSAIDTAYRNLACRVTHTTGATSTTDISDNFSVRPSFLTISSNMTNATSSGDPKTKAGDTFELTATAIPGYDNTPSIDNSKIQAHIAAVQAGTISGIFSPADSTTGIANGTAFTYSEVGSLQFLINGIFDDSFTAVDQGGDCSDDFSNTLTNGQYGCKFGNLADSDYFGRFTPDHYALISSSILPACGVFTYMDQLLGISYVIEAQNSSGVTTQNYHANSNFVKATDIEVTAEQDVDLSSRISMLYNASNWQSGRYTITNGSALFSRLSNAVDGAYKNLDIGVKVIDMDAIVLINPNMLSTDNTQASCGAACLEVKLGTTDIRYGRLNISSVHGSELVDLTMPLSIEYFNGSDWIINTSDSCTSLTTDSHLTFTAHIAPEPSHGPNMLTMSSGTSSLIFTAPGEANQGYIDVTGSLSSAPTFTWLTYDWNGDGVYSDNPTARATFGIYKSNDKIIFRRELY